MRSTVTRPRAGSVCAWGAWWCGRGVCAQPALNPPLWARLSREARGVRLYLGLLSSGPRWPRFSWTEPGAVHPVVGGAPRTGVLYYIEQMDFLREQCHAASLPMGILAGELMEAETTYLSFFYAPDCNEGWSTFARAGECPGRRGAFQYLHYPLPVRRFSPTGERSRLTG